ncbi:MAG: DUF1127 domain-containing protein [Hyphomicrobiaceae bacterium]
MLRFAQIVLQVASERKRLASLDDRLLADIGLSRSLAALEAGRELGDVPKHRLG